MTGLDELGRVVALIIAVLFTAAILGAVSWWLDRRIRDVRHRIRLARQRDRTTAAVLHARARHHSQRNVRIEDLPVRRSER